VNRRFGGAGIRRGVRANGSGSSSVAAYSPTSEAGYTAWFDHTYGYAKDTGALLDGRLSLLLDRSNTYTIAQGTSGNQPLWSNTGILGRAAAYYTTDDYMATLDGVLAGILDGTQAYTAYEVVKRDNTALSENTWSLGVSGSAATALFNRFFAAPDQQRRFDAGAGSTATGTISTTTSVMRVTRQYTGSAWNTWIGSSLSSNAVADTQSVGACDRFYVGAQRFSGVFGSFFSGWIGDIIIYTAAHDAAARARVWAYLQTLYVGLT